jgi:hypothetical protein
MKTSQKFTTEDLPQRAQRTQRLMERDLFTEICKMLNFQTLTASVLSVVKKTISKKLALPNSQARRQTTALANANKLG